MLRSLSFLFVVILSLVYSYSVGQCDATVLVVNDGNCGLSLTPSVASYSWKNCDGQDIGVIDSPLFLNDFESLGPFFLIYTGADQNVCEQEITIDLTDIPLSCQDGFESDFENYWKPDVYYTFDENETVEIGGDFYTSDTYGKDIMSSRFITASEFASSLTDNPGNVPGAVGNCFTSYQAPLDSDDDPTNDPQKWPIDFNDDIAFEKALTIEFLARLDLESGSDYLSVFTPVPNNCNDDNYANGLMFRLINDEGGNPILRYGFGVEVSEVYFQNNNEDGCLQSSTLHYPVNSSETGLSLEDMTSLNHDGWSHFVMIIDLESPVLPTMSLYWNGLKINESNLNNTDFYGSQVDYTELVDDGDPLTTDLFDIGRTRFNGTGASNSSGFLDEFAIYFDKKLSPTLIAQHYEDALINNGHYTYSPQSEAVCDLPTPLVEPLVKYKQSDYPFGYMESEFEGGQDIENNILPPGDLQSFQSSNWNANLQPAIDQLESFQLPRYKPNHLLNRNFPWWEFDAVNGRRNGSDGQDFMTAGIRMIEEFSQNWNYALLMPKRNTSGGGQYGASRIVAEYANEHPEIPLSVHLNWGQGQRYYLAPNANLYNPYLDEINYYYGTQRWSVLGSTVPAFEDGIAIYSTQLGSLNPEDPGGIHYLQRPLDWINENGELTALSAGNMNFFERISPDLYVFDYETFSNSYNASNYADELSSQGLDVSGATWAPGGSVVNARRSINRVLDENVTNFRKQYFEGLKQSHPNLTNATQSFYSVDGAGGHSGYPRYYDYEDMKSVNTPLTNPYDQSLLNYSTPDLYPLVHSWQTSVGPRHGLDWIESSFAAENNYVALENDTEADPLTSLFVNAGWNYPERNLRSAQYLGLIKASIMYGAEFFYGSEFGLWYETNFFPSPRNYIWQFVAPSYAQAMISRHEEFLFQGHFYFDQEPDLLASNPLNSYKWVTGNPNRYGNIRKINGHDVFLMNVLWGKASNRYTETGLTAVDEKPANFLNFNGLSVTVNSRLQGSTYVMNREDLNEVVFYQLDGWHESSHPSWWEKGFLIEAELNDNNKNDNYDAIGDDSQCKLTTLVHDQGVYDAIADGTHTDFTDFLTYQQPIQVENLLTYTFAPRSALDSETHNFDLYFRAASDDTQNATVAYRILDEQGAVISSAIIEIDNESWIWYEASSPCNDCSNSLCELASGTYQIELELSTNCMLDKFYLHAKQPTSDAYYLTANMDYGSFANNDDILASLYPDLAETVPTFVTATLLTDTDVAIIAEEYYCSTVVDIPIESSSSVNCQELEYSWVLSQRMDCSDCSACTFIATDEINAGTSTSNTFSYDFTTLHGCFELAIAVVGEPNIAPVYFRIAEPLEVVVSGPTVVNHGQEVVFTGVVTNTADQVQTLGIDEEVSWFPNVYGSQSSDFGFTLLAQNETSNPIVLNGSYGSPNYTMTFTDEYGCSYEGNADLTIQPCDLQLPIFEPYQDLPLAEFWTNQNEGDLGTTTLNIQYESVSSILDNAFGIPEGFEITFDIEGDLSILPTSELIDGVEYFDVEIESTFNGYAMIHYFLSDGQCMSDDFFMVTYENKGCLDPNAINYDIAATSWSDDGDWYASGFNTAFVFVEVLNYPQCHSDCLGETEVAEFLPDDLIESIDWYQRGLNFSNIEVWLQNSPDQMCLGASRVEVNTTYGCTYRRDFNIADMFDPEINIEPAACGSGEYDVTITHNLNPSASIQWYNVNDDSFVEEFDSSTLATLPPGDYTAFIEFNNSICIDLSLDFTLEPMDDCSLSSLPAPTYTFDGSSDDTYLDNASYYYTDNVTFTSGYSGTISNATFCFLPGTALTIDPGADVTFNNCTFTSCGVWSGIYIPGINGSSTVRFMGGSIQYAHEAIIMYGGHPLSNSPVDLYCYGVDFIDNRMSFHAGAVRSASALPTFEACIFEQTENFFQRHNNHKPQIQIVWSEDFSVLDCQFVNDNHANVSDYSDLSHAIFTFDTNISVRGSSFQFYDRAISCADTDEMSGVELIENTISNCQKGIVCTGLVASQIVDNDIFLGGNIGGAVNVLDHPLEYDIDPQEGIVLLGGGYYFIQENSITDLNENLFSYYEPSNIEGADDIYYETDMAFTIGIRSRDLHAQHEVIRKNELQGLTYGNLANGANVDPDEQDLGLRYLCNTNINNEFDFAVAGFPLYLEEDDIAIGNLQQEVDLDALGNIIEIPTGNTHTSTGFDLLAEDAGQFDHRGEQTIEYLYNEIEPDQQLNFQYYDTENIFAIETVSDPQCQSDNVTEVILVALDQGTFIADNDAELEDLYEMRAEVEFLYLSLIDDGNTQQMIQDVGVPWAADVWQRRDFMLSKSPNLSTKVAYEIADDVLKYPHAIALDIFIANPHLAQDRRFMRYLKTKANPMPESMRDLLSLANDQGSLRNELSRQRENLRIATQNIEQQQLHLYMLDGVSSDSIFNHIENMNTFYGDMILTEYALSQGINANDRLDDLFDHAFNRDQLLTDELLQYEEWFDLRTNLIADSRQLDSLLPAERSVLESMANDYFYTEAGKKAIAWLDFSEEGWFIPPAFNGIAEFEFRRSVLVEEDPSFKAKVYPNPTDAFVTFEIVDPAQYRGVFAVQLFDMTGRLIQQYTMGEGESYMMVNTTSIAAGSYRYQIIADENILQNGSIEVVH